VAPISAISSFSKRVASRARWERARRSGGSVAPVIEAVVRDHLTYLERDALLDLSEAVERIERDGIEGAVLEAGTARGGSALVLAASKSPERPLHLYDTFGLIPPPSDRDGEDVKERYEVIASGEAEGPGGSRYYGYEEDLLGQIRDLFATHGLPPGEHSVEFFQGLFQDTMRIERPVALAHLDSDWFDSVHTCLERIAPRLSVGGRFVIDDYGAWSGARDAVDEFFKDRRDGEFEFEEHARLHIVRRSAPAA
jgi:asparagine synthase (glutamine-hydrolysing)